GFTESKQAGYRRHEVVVDPQPAHRVMDRRKDPHWNFIWIFAGDAVVHVEQVAVPFANALLSKTLDRIRKVEIYAKTRFANAAPFIADLFCVTRGDVSRDEVAKARIFPFEVIVALVL